jgi:hypothetical protein
LGADAGLRQRSDPRAAQRRRGDHRHDDHDHASVVVDDHHLVAVEQLLVTADHLHNGRNDDHEARRRQVQVDTAGWAPDTIHQRRPSLPEDPARRL